jgi:hypothetical protein
MMLVMSDKRHIIEHHACASTIAHCLEQFQPFLVERLGFLWAAPQTVCFADTAQRPANTRFIIQVAKQRERLSEKPFGFLRIPEFHRYKAQSYKRPCLVIAVVIFASNLQRFLVWHGLIS